MSVGSPRNAAVIGSLMLLCSLGFGAWTQLNSGTSADLMSVHFPEGTQVGYAVGSSPEGGGVALKTTDGGTTWAAQSPGTMSGLNSVYFKDNNTGFAVGAAGTAITTTDGGTTWTPMTVAGAGTDQLTRVQFPENGQIGYIGVKPRTQAAKVFKTTDGGANWTSPTVGGPLSWSTSVGMATDNIGVAVGSGGMVYSTTDGFGSNTANGAWTSGEIVAAAYSRTDPTKGYLVANDTLQGVIRSVPVSGVLWDSVRCPDSCNFLGVDMPTTEVAYVCGANGFIGRTVFKLDVWKTTVPLAVTATMHGLCFPAGMDTGYAVGNGGTILKTTDGGVPWIIGVAEGKAPAIARAGIRVVSNPCPHGIALHSDADVRVSVFDAAGRAVMSRAATKGTNFLPLRAGAYFVKAGAQTARAVVTD